LTIPLEGGTLAMMRSTATRRTPRHAFTLVEILVAIGILVLLAAIATPVALNALKSAQASALKMEVNGLADAIEQYRSKYGDYPPDGSNWTILERHCRKAFPQILETELNLLRRDRLTSLNYKGPGFPSADSEIDFRVMSPAEALVFFLGGFSSNPQRPFTGPGGPFALVPGSTTAYQYNPARENAFFEFNSGQLTLTTSSFGGQTVTVSNDESRFQMGDAANGLPEIDDLLPVYLDKYQRAPIVYFDSRTYAIPDPLGTGAAIVYVNRISSPQFGTAVPYLSDEMNTTIAPSQNYFQNKQSFQIVSAGLDGIYSDALGVFTSKSTPNIGVGDLQVYQRGMKTASKSTSNTYDNTSNFSDMARLGDVARKATVSD
jgi:prepilin-type N-terminal cleavage/methylation domain-containing protein